MNLIAKAKGLALRSPLLRAVVVRTRDKAAVVAARLAGERRMAEAAHGRIEFMELEIYRLRSDLNRAVAQAQRERDRNLELLRRLKAASDVNA
ncbi:MAG: hypothetical protein M9944_02120 [Rhizobiaceae bacterium]|nr:hypothetical protein [Rhizobiaceae bacterium]MCO5069989.1 hypothetical protein [Rhizobiaceae bacterium]